MVNQKRLPSANNGSKVDIEMIVNRCLQIDKCTYIYYIHLYYIYRERLMMIQYDSCWPTMLNDDGSDNGKNKIALLEGGNRIIAS